MAVFLGVHKFENPLTDEQVREGWEKYKAAAATMGVRPIRVHYNNEKGAYCESEAQSEADVRKAHEQASIPLEDVLEVKTI